MQSKNNTELSIVMYHYVRDLKRSKYPEIKGLDLALFKEQIKYIKKFYNVISAYDLFDAVVMKQFEDLPSRALLLTFDDGYIDHYRHVFPVLAKENLPGCFFPPAKAISESKVLDVNKIHFILANVQEKSILVGEIFRLIDIQRSSFELKPNDTYWKTLAVRTSLDSAQVMFIKRMLQFALPSEVRHWVADQLFKQYVSSDETSFSSELYMSFEELTFLQNNNMYVGSHGFDHVRLNSIPAEEQKYEVDLSLGFLESIGSPVDRWMMCYPHGTYDQSLVSVLIDRNCTVGISCPPVAFGIADLDSDNCLTLPRLDTNDLPKCSNAEPNCWTQKVLQN